MKYSPVQGEFDRLVSPSPLRSAGESGLSALTSSPSSSEALVSPPLASSLPTMSEYLLVCTAQSVQLGSGSWYFSLESAEGESVLEASDEELGDLNRLTLLAAVRGLEAIDGSSAVTLLSHNRYLIRSLSDSLPRWRENDFVWEHFGRRIDVQHADLWRRIDHALSIHRLEACLVSSRLISGGLDTAVSPPTNESTNLSGGPDGVTWRADSSHGGAVSKAGGPDRLRQWLLGDASANRRHTSSHRFRASDLIKTHS